MNGCLAVGTLILHLASPDFTLSWTHSVERVTWQEDWRLDNARLSLVAARIKGSGAGMEPGEGAILTDGWWEWPGDLTVARLSLAASGATGAGWTLCAGGTCHTIAARAGEPVNVASCNDGAPQGKRKVTGPIMDEPALRAARR